MQMRSGIKPGPRKILLYGEHGVGKSTWANSAPSPFFLNIEDGLDDIDCRATEKLGTLEDVVQAIRWLATQPHDFKTIAVDSLDWLEKLIFKDVAAAANKQTVGEVAYGKGYDQAAKKWEFILGGFDTLKKKGMGIILLAHAKIVRFNDPSSSAYDRYEPDLHASSCAMIQEWCQDVLFAQFRVFTRVEEQGFGKSRTLAVGGKDRFIQTSKTATAEAKNRVEGLPDEIPMTWGDYAKYVTAAYAKRAEVSLAPAPESAPASEIAA